MNPSHILPNRFYAKMNVRILLNLLIVTILALAPSLIFVASTQVQTQQQKDENTIPSPSRKGSLVRGRVIYEDNRRPLRRVEVMISDPANRGRRRYLMAWTNGAGEFQLKDVPPGKYFVTVNAPGIIRSGPYDSEEAERNLTSVTVDGAPQSEVVVRVKRGGAISGKVTYADGDPAVNASIRVLRKKDGKWMPVYVGGPSTDRVLTDERGVYRVSGLSPGEYLIGAAQQKLGVELMAQDDPDGGNMLNRALLPATYYDGAVSLSVATLLRVEAGDEKTDINITLAERPLHSISGVVNLKGENRPVARARLSLKRKDEELDSRSDLEQPVVNTDEQGRFIFDEVPEGIYTMTVTPPQRRYQDGQSALQANTEPIQNFAPKHMELNVAGIELNNLVIEVSSGGRVSGVVTVDGGKPLPRNAFVILERASGEVSDPLGTAIQPDGTFTLEGIPSGKYDVKTSVRPGGEYYTKSVMQGRADLTRAPLTVKEDEDISKVRILISADVARLSGRILASDGKTPKGAVSILLVSADSVEGKTIGRRMYALTNADGGFNVSGAPGEYLAIVMRSNDDFYALRGDKLISRAAKAQRITLQAGENNRIDLIVPDEK